MKDYKSEYVDIDDVPTRKNQRLSVWRQRFSEVPEGKAVMLHYNNRQRVHQVRQSVRSMARHHGVRIQTRIIHAELAIHEMEGWLLYWWKEGS